MPNCYIVNPWHDRKNADGDKAEILVHRAEVPSHLLGCIAPGTLVGSRMTKSTEAMKTIWEQAGGTPGKDKVVVTFKVTGNMPASWESCQPYTGNNTAPGGGGSSPSSITDMLSGF